MDEPQVLASGDCRSNIALPVDHDSPSQIQRRDQSRSMSPSTLAVRIRPVSVAPSMTRLGPLPSLTIPIHEPTLEKGSIEQSEAVFATPLASCERTCESSLIAGGLRSRRAARGRLARRRRRGWTFGGLANGRARMAWARKTYF